MPVIGMIPMFIPTLTKTWNRIIATMPPAIDRAEQVLGHRQDAQRPPDEERVEREHERGADEAPALADHREDEVRVLLGEELQRRSASPRSPRPVRSPEPIAITDWFCW